MDLEESTRTTPTEVTPSPVKDEVGSPNESLNIFTPSSENFPENALVPRSLPSAQHPPAERIDDLEASFALHRQEPVSSSVSPSDKSTQPTVPNLPLLQTKGLEFQQSAPSLPDQPDTPRPQVQDPPESST